MCDENFTLSVSPFRSLCLGEVANDCWVAVLLSRQATQWTTLEIDQSVRRSFRRTISQRGPRAVHCPCKLILDYSVSSWIVFMAFTIILYSCFCSPTVSAKPLTTVSRNAKQLLTINDAQWPLCDNLPSLPIKRLMLYFRDDRSESPKFT